ncbi:hypothetical protein M5689_023024 [Euphorbia peplus]|nr:hypothetical protein M5689_023024 [Euphorbia peplus]
MEKRGVNKSISGIAMLLVIILIILGTESNILVKAEGADCFKDCIQEKCKPPKRNEMCFLRCTQLCWWKHPPPPPPPPQPLPPPPRVPADNLNNHFKKLLI